MNLVNWRLLALTGLGASLAFTTACDDKSTTSEETGDPIVIGDDGDDTSSSSSSTDTGLAGLYHIGAAQVTTGIKSSLDGGYAAFQTYSWAASETRCFYIMEWTSATPTSDCLDCEWAFDITYDAPYVYDGAYCEDIDLSGLAGWETGIGYAETTNNYWGGAYGTGDFMYKDYYGAWTYSYPGYASFYPTGGPYGYYNFYWFEYWGSFYYYQ